MTLCKLDWRNLGQDKYTKTQNWGKKYIEEKLKGQKSPNCKSSVNLFSASNPFLFLFTEPKSADWGPGLEEKNNLRENLELQRWQLGAKKLFHNWKQGSAQENSEFFISKQWEQRIIVEYVLL